MKLRSKISIIILSILVIMITMTYLGSVFIIKNSYLELEHQSVTNNLDRISETLDQMTESVSSVLGSWAIWDDTYKFMADKNQNYIDSNLNVNSFTSSGIDMVLYFDAKGKLFYSIAADQDHKNTSLVPSELFNYLKPDGKIVHQPKIDSGMTGLVLLDNGLLMVGSHSIVTSNNTGPARGTLMMGKYFNDQSLAKLKQITKVDTEIFLLNKIESNKSLVPILNKLKNSDYEVIPGKDGRIYGFKFIKDINGNPIAIVKASLPRSVYIIGNNTINYYNILAICSSLIMIIVLWLTLHTFITKRIETLLRNMLNADKETDYLPKITNDVLDEMTLLNILYQHATHDPLTGIGNRHLVYQGFENRVKNLRTDHKLILLFIDIDHFKQVNDTLGHDVGDELLIFVAKRFSSLLHPGDLAVRLGGDEFVVLLSDVEIQAIHQRIKLIFESLHNDVIIKEHELHVTCSIGISIYPDNGNDIASLIKYADIALYQAKAHGRNRYQLYSEELIIALQEANKREMELQRAIDNKELCLFYQPIFDPFTKRIKNIEALIRWRHPQHGLLAAKDIIPIAEKSGLIIPIGKWVLHTACAQLKLWQEQGLPLIPVAVNLSLLQIRSLSITSLVSDALQKTGLDPHHLELEITETSYIELSAELINELYQLKARGVKLTVDDFGAGYSGLAYLKRLPIGKLKIDQSFIRDIHTDPDDRAIVLAIIAIAHQLNLEVVAEGVETKDQLEFLKAHQVDAIQGNYLSKPLSADDYKRFVEELPTMVDIVD